ncbi:galactosylgalactosylxylosylprotein 3-beta-glucuronosyltransferase 2 isoform X2 [Odocoileus virginianus]|uniref:Galactosylgalactosylxylosylprotein 3-beta-glucuronosyltransferase 2 isoform X2 n=1 Tax=Odocoileus virginianus TaxID=9874 RepID=A0ABM4GSL8_ODOVR
MISAFRGKRFLSARCGPPPAHKPCAGSQRRYPTPSPAAPLLSLPTRGLPRFRHVPVFSWLVSKDLAAFPKAKSAEVGGASERASSPSPRPRRPTGTLLPLPLGGAAAASGVGSPGRLPASPRSPTPPVAALLSLHRRTGGDAGVCSAPAPRFFFLSRLWDLAVGAGRGCTESSAERRDPGTGFRGGARTELGARHPKLRLRFSPPRLGCNEGEHSSPVPHACLPTPRAHQGPTAGVPLLAAPRDRSQLPRFGKSAVGSPPSRRPAQLRGRRRARLDRVPLPADYPPACTPCKPELPATCADPARPAPRPRSAPPPHGVRAGRGFLSADASAVQTARWGPPTQPRLGRRRGRGRAHHEVCAVQPLLHPPALDPDRHHHARRGHAQARAPAHPAPLFRALLRGPRGLPAPVPPGRPGARQGATQRIVAAAAAAAARAAAAHHLCHHSHLQPPGAEGRADPPGQHVPPGGAAALDPGGGRGGAQRAGEPLPGARGAAQHSPACPHAPALQATRAAARYGAAQRRPGLAAPEARAPARAARRALLRRRRQHLQSGALPGDANDSQGLGLAGGPGRRAALRTSAGGERQSRGLVHRLEGRQAFRHRHGRICCKPSGHLVQPQSCI